MAFNDNLAALCQKLKKKYPPTPSCFKVKQLLFTWDTGQEVITGDKLGGGSRAFFEDILLTKDEKAKELTIPCEELLPAAEKYYAEYWNDRPGTGIHKVIDMLKMVAANHGKVTIITKELNR